MKESHIKSKSILKIVFGAILVTFSVTCVSTLLYCVYLANQIENRFAGRRWNIPSTVYSDSTLLYPGQAINHLILMEKLKRLGYREVKVNIL